MKNCSQPEGTQVTAEDLRPLRDETCLWRREERGRHTEEVLIRSTRREWKCEWDVYYPYLRNWKVYSKVEREQRWKNASVYHEKSPQRVNWRHDASNHRMLDIRIYLNIRAMLVSLQSTIHKTSKHLFRREQLATSRTAHLFDIGRLGKSNTRAIRPPHISERTYARRKIRRTTTSLAAALELETEAQVDEVWSFFFQVFFFNTNF